MVVGELLNLWQSHCIVPDQMMRVMILNDSNVDKCPQLYLFVAFLVMP